MAFTDGVTEALDPNGTEFGAERLKDLLQRARGASASDVAALLTETMKAWVGAAEQHDDLKFVVLAMR